MQAQHYSKDFFSDAFIQDPIPHYKEMRDLGSVVWMAQNNCYAATTHGAVVQALRTPHIFRSGRGLSLNDEVNKILAGSTLHSDDPEHKQMKSVTMRPLLPKNLEPLDAQIKELATALAADLAAREQFDAVTDFAQAVPLAFVTSLVGLPEEGASQMLKWASATFNLFEGSNPRSQEAFQHLVGLQAFLKAHCRADAMRPGSLAHRIFEVAPDHGYTDQDAQRLIRDYVAPSLDTTISVLGFAAYYFAKFPEQWDAIRADESLIPNAIEEIVRLTTPIRAFTRYIEEDTELDGTPLEAGARIFLIFASANRDETVFENADDLDVRRSVRNHVGFGHGTHSCLGMHLARKEMFHILSQMRLRVAQWHVEGPGEVGLNNIIRGYARLPVRITPGNL